MEDGDENLRSIVGQMKEVALQVGPMHSWWDIIFDMECFLNDKPTILNKTQDEWINYGTKLLKDYHEHNGTHIDNSC